MSKPEDVRAVSSRGGRPVGTTAMTEERVRRRYSEAYYELVSRGYEPSDRALADAMGLHPRTLSRYRVRFDIPRGSTGDPL